MASFGTRSLRGASRLILQAAGSQCRRIASQARSPNLQTSQALHQVAGISLVKQAQRQFVVSMSRTVTSTCAILSTAAPGSVISPDGSSDVADSSLGGEDDGLVIKALEKLDDL